MLLPSKSYEDILKTAGVSIDGDGVAFKYENNPINLGRNVESSIGKAVLVLVGRVQNKRITS